jgi:hypothetical protein
VAVPSSGGKSVAMTSAASRLAKVTVAIMSPGESHRPRGGATAMTMPRCGSGALAVPRTMRQTATPATRGRNPWNPSPAGSGSRSAPPASRR